MDCTTYPLGDTEIKYTLTVSAFMNWGNRLATSAMMPFYSFILERIHFLDDVAVYRVKP